MNIKQQHIAIFGPTGYIGTKIMLKLYNQGHKLSLFSRSIRKLLFLQDECTLLASKDPRVCIIEQFLEKEFFNDIIENLQGVDVIYYLIHSLNLKDGDFKNLDNELATLVAKAAKQAGVKQIIYLGGLGVDTPDAPLSKHLKSRQETAQCLRANHPCVTEFRAGVIIGAGSASFEIIRNLGVKLPFLPQLPGVEGLCQPIFVDDVIIYLVRALLNPLYYNQIAEIGSKDIFHYTGMVADFAWVNNKKILRTLPMPYINKILTPSVIAWFASRMTPLPYILIEPLIEGMHSRAIVHDFPVKKIDPDFNFTPLDFKVAVEIVLKRLEVGDIDSIWSTPYELSVLNAKYKKQFLYVTSHETQGMLYEACSADIPVEKTDNIFYRIKQIGGKNGYYSPRWLWEIRGIIDKIFGGPGLSTSKRRIEFLRVGDRVDFWVVTFYKNTANEKIIRLKANMRTPGNAWLQFVIKKNAQGDKAVLDLRAYFEPSGMLGYLYWYSLYFIHKFIFKDMVKNIIKGA